MYIYILRWLKAFVNFGINYHKTVKCDINKKYVDFRNAKMINFLRNVIFLFDPTLFHFKERCMHLLYLRIKETKYVNIYMTKTKRESLYI